MPLYPAKSVCEGMENQPRAAAHERSVDPDKLQVPANFELDFARDFDRVPAFDDRRDQGVDGLAASHGPGRPWRPGSRRAR